MSCRHLDARPGSLRLIHRFICDSEQLLGLLVEGPRRRDAKARRERPHERIDVRLERRHDARDDVTPFVFAIVLLGIDIVLSAFLVFHATGDVHAARSIEVMPSVIETLTALLLLVQSHKVRRIFDSHLHGECQYQNPAMIKAQRIQSSFSRAWVLVFQIYYLQHIINMQLVQDKSVVAA